MAIMAALLADSGSNFGHMDWNGGGWWMLMFWGPVFMIGLVALVVWLVRSPTASGSTGGGRGSVDHLDSARRILAERYARGELDSEEYRDRLERLG